MIRLTDLEFAYRGSAGPVLRIERLELQAGERVLLTGPSGSGKTTLLQLVAGILPVTRGELIVAGEPLQRLGERQRRLFRSRQIGFIFQDFELVEYLNVRDNILLPFLVQPGLRTAGEGVSRLKPLLESLGLAGLAARHPHQLSFGERQRVAIARSVVTRPGLLLADEPTASLDRRAADQTLDLIERVLGESGAALLMVSHDDRLEARFARILRMEELNRVPAQPVLG